jgi:hypothetical protein
VLDDADNESGHRAGIPACAGSGPAQRVAHAGPGHSVCEEGGLTEEWRLQPNSFHIADYGITVVGPVDTADRIRQLIWRTTFMPAMA